MLGLLIKSITFTHLTISTSSIWCMGLMLPLNVLTDTYPTGTNNTVKVNNKIKRPETEFEEIVSGQGVFLFGLINIFVPYYGFYNANIEIIFQTAKAYLLFIKNIKSYI